MSVPTLRTFASALRAHRKAAGLTQHALAGALGLDRLTIWRWEQGTHSPPVKDLDRLAAALGCPPAALFTEEARNASS